jgi:hypothetical protein
MAEIPKRDWKEIVDKSNGKSLFAPDSLIEKIKAYDAKRKAFAKRINEVAKDEVETNVMFQNLILDIRKHYADADPEIWSADVGFNSDALREGQFIINIDKTQK